ncbi:MAG: trehalose-6-phosphate synthase [Bacteroides sp. SM23_62_1]|nr:MAG: trehalose-6-phosphate synthase [Bacteroides sp. SM23_62_1]
MGKLILITNELPYILTRDDKGELIPGIRETGFPVAISPYYMEKDCIWYGSPGIDSEDLSKREKGMVVELLKDMNCYPVFLPGEERKRFLDGFCYRTIWPLFHYFNQNTIYEEKHWEAYIKVNRIYADAVYEHLEEGDRIWIQNYQLMLLPGLLREKNPDIPIGFFLHIPFPSFEMFRLLPWRSQILEGLLGADLVGFHTYDYERHFMSCVRRLLGYESVLNRIHLEERTVKVDFFPLGIDYQRFHNATLNKLNSFTESPLRKTLIDQNLMGKDKKLILSIDRLDYTKGIARQLRAFELFLEKYPSYRGKVNLLFYVTPSRESVEQYKILKRELDELVGKINSRFGNISWIPIRYFYRTISFDEIIELYIVSDIALITPVRDGMNLIAKEFIASKIDRKGVLIISEMAGASKEMSEAIIVNPNNQIEMADAIKEALEMPEKEQLQRNEILQKRLQRYNEEKWATDFLNSLDEVMKIQEIKRARKINPDLRAQIKTKYSAATRRLFFLDYDGTLIGFHKDPQAVYPDEELYDILKNLTETKGNKVIIISGRDKETLGKWFSKIRRIGFIAEHGVWSKEPGGEWGMTEQIDKQWMDVIRPTLEFYVDRTPRSFIEQKNYSLVWHYRDADPDLGEIRSWELKEDMKEMTANLNLEIMDGDKVIEIKNSGINKGRAALNKIGNQKFDFILAVGDDWTDEYTFGAMPEEAITIKVGTKTTKARYYIDDVEDVRRLLKDLV